MIRRNSIAALFCCLIFLAPDLCAQSLSEVLGAVSRNVREFQELLPDFVCTEKITSTKLDSGKIKEQRVVESIFTGIQRPSRVDNIRLSFTETREVTSIDGKPARPGAGMPKLPLSSTGGFSSLLIMTFSPDHLQFHDYEMESETDERLVIRFATKEDQQKLGTVFEGKVLLARDAGEAWVAPESMQIARLERRFFNIPTGYSSSVTTVEYGPVTIGERQFWMPRTVQAEVAEHDPKKTAVYTAEYTNCRKFGASVQFELAH